MGRAMQSLRFLQFSDLGFGSRLDPILPYLSEEKLAELQRDRVAVLGQIIGVAAAQKVDAILCCGGLWEEHSLSDELAAGLLAEIARSEVPVLVVPGSVDPYHRFSFYDEAYVRTKPRMRAPENLEVFRSGRVERRTLASLPDADFFGVGHTLTGGAPQVLSGDFHVIRRHCANVAVLAQDAALQLEGMDYIARPGKCAVPLLTRPGEADPEVLIVTVDADAHTATVEPLSLPVRVMHDIKLPVESVPANCAELLELLSRCLEEHEVAKEDCAVVTLSGCVDADSPAVALNREWVTSRCFHLLVRDNGLTAKGPGVNVPSDETLTKRLVGRVTAEIESSDVSPATAGAAAFAAMDALRGREVRVHRVY